MAYSVAPHYAPANPTTEAFVASCVDQVDKRKGIPTDALRAVVSGALALRGYEVRLKKEGLTDEYKRAVDAVKDTLVGTLLTRHGQHGYYLHPDVPEGTFVKDISPEADLRFRVIGQYARWASRASIPSAGMVSLLSARRAVTLTMPQVAQTIQHLRNGELLPVRFEQLHEPIEIDEATWAVVAELRSEAVFWINKLGYVGVLVDSPELDQFTFAVTEANAERFPDWLEVKTRHVFKKHNVPFARFHSIITLRNGRSVSLKGRSTEQNLLAASGQAVRNSICDAPPEGLTAS